MLGSGTKCLKALSHSHCFPIHILQISSRFWSSIARYANSSVARDMSKSRSSCILAPAMLRFCSQPSKFNRGTEHLQYLRLCSPFLVVPGSKMCLMVMSQPNRILQEHSCNYDGWQ